MTGAHVNPAEALRDPASAMAPDPRTGMFAGQAALSLAAHHEDIATVQLSPAVPEPIVIQFDTASALQAEVAAKAIRSAEFPYTLRLANGRHGVVTDAVSPQPRDQ